MNDAKSDVEVPAKRGVMRRLGRGIGVGLIGFAIIVMFGWSLLAICYTDLHRSGPRFVLAGIVGVGAVVGLIFVRPRKLATGGCVALFLAVLGWFFSIRASNERDWIADVARVPEVAIDGDDVTVKNVRNFKYRSESDFTERWETRTYRLSELRGVDVMLVYWGSKNIAHGMVSFDFGNDRYLAVSIETRKEKGEKYSATEGFFRQYELIYIFADERDVVRVRTNFRNEDVYLYRTNMSGAQARALFMEYARHANELAKGPEFYNALTSNCVTNVVYLARSVNPSASISWDVILSGRAARQAYRNGWLDSRLSFEELEKRSYINDAAHKAGGDEGFSRRIREGLPAPEKRRS